MQNIVKRMESHFSLWWLIEWNSCRHSLWTNKIIYQLSVIKSFLRFLFEGGASVTRCQNKNSPIFFKICPKSSKRKFYSKVPFSKKPKSCKMGTLWEPLLPRPSKSSPIRSHWVALTICLLHSREIVGSSRRGGGGMSRKNDNFLQLIFSTTFFFHKFV